VEEKTLDTVTSRSREHSGFVLNPGAGLRLDEGACLPLRSDFGGCRACEAACPAKVLRVDTQAVALADGCLDCGRCVAACPTDALSLDAMPAANTVSSADAPLEVECAKVPARHCAPGALRVPCLGALSVGRLAALHEVAGNAGVSMVDRGWCSGCSASGGARPGDEVRDRLALWLDAVGDPRPAPRWISRPLPATEMPERIPRPDDAAPKPALSRRQFFGTIATDPLGARRNVTPMGGAGRPAHPASRRREAPDRNRLLGALRAAAARAGRALPAELFPRLVNSGACVDHRVCVAACPTNALEVATTESGASLTLSGDTCIACGACTRACPEGALSLDAHGGEPGSAVVATHAQRVCTACGDTFAPRAGESTCLSCTKSRRFMGDAMTRLFGTRN
jgi:ferredoxin